MSSTNLLDNENSSCYTRHMRVALDTQRFKQLCKQNKKPHRLIAEALGVNPKSVLAWQWDEYPLLSRMCTALGCHPFNLLDIDDNGTLYIVREKVEQEMEEVGIKLGPLAEICGVHRTTLWRSLDFRFVRLSALARVLEVSPIYLLAITDEEPL